MTAKSHKETAAERRDNRSTKIDDSASKPISAKKDTKSWCKGKVGKEHTLKVFEKEILYTSKKGITKNLYKGFFELCCSTCGKIVDSYVFYWGLSKKSKPLPDWLVEYEKNK